MPRRRTSERFSEYLWKRFDINSQVLHPDSGMPNRHFLSRFALAKTRIRNAYHNREITRMERDSLLVEFQSRHQEADEKADIRRYDEAARRYEAELQNADST